MAFVPVAVVVVVVVVDEVDHSMWINQPWTTMRYVLFVLNVIDCHEYDLHCGGAAKSYSFFFVKMDVFFWVVVSMHVDCVHHDLILYLFLIYQIFLIYLVHDLFQVSFQFDLLDLFQWYRCERLNWSKYL